MQETAPGRWVSDLPPLPSLGYQDTCTCSLQPWFWGVLILILQTLSSPMGKPRTQHHQRALSVYLFRCSKTRDSSAPILGLSTLSWCHWGNDGIIKKNGEPEDEVPWAVSRRMQHGAHPRLKSRGGHQAAGCAWEKPKFK